MADLLVWLLAVQVIGLLAFPIAYTLFPRLTDAGYSFAKPLGLVFLAYPLWLLGSLQIVQIHRPVVFGALVALGIMGAVVGIWQQPSMMAFLNRRWKSLLGSEAVFLGFFLFWALYRAHDPGYVHTEQPMDLALLNASFHAYTFPPVDPWLSGQAVSYYYFGYLIVAFVAKISFLTVPVAYNLGLALIAGLTAQGAYGLVRNMAGLTRVPARVALVAAVSAPILLLIVGNLEGVLELASHRGWGSPIFWDWLNIKDLRPVSGTSWLPDTHWWWWNASRVLSPALDIGYEETISEFPFFSLLVGDLHPHLMALPWVLLILAFGLNMMSDLRKSGVRWVKETPFYLPIVSLVLGGAAFVNLWDFPTYTVLLGVIVLMALVIPREGYSTSLMTRLGIGFLVILILGTMAVVFYLPFYSNLDIPISEIRPVTTVVSRFSHQLVFWGLLLFITLSMALTQLSHVLKVGFYRTRVMVLAAGMTVFPAVCWMIAAGEPMDSERFLLLLPWGILFTVLVFCGVSRMQVKNTEIGSVYALVLGSFAVLLIIGSELFYVHDLFGIRMNTFFKLYYQSWTLLAMAAAWGLGYLIYVWKDGKQLPPLNLIPRLLWRAFFIVLLLGSLYYPYAALTTRVGDHGKALTFDGLSVLEASWHPGDSGDYAVVRWMQTHASADEVLVEAVGPSYTAHGRLAAFTGIPTVLGWEGHEQQWRGSFEALAERRRDVQCIYTCLDREQVISLLREYGVDYVVVGLREKQAYGDQVPLLDFRAVLLEAETFQVPGVKIYRVVLK